jgi:hypothetical protein
VAHGLAPSSQRVAPLDCQRCGLLKRRNLLIAARTWLRTLAVSAVLSLSVACGSAQGDQPASGAGSAGASDGGGFAGGGASSAAAGHNGGGSAGESSGAAGVQGGSGGASGGSAGASGGSLGAAGGGAKGGAGGGGASGGSGGVVQAPACPAFAPLGASSCDSDGQVCFYEDCVGAGRTVATCQKLGGPRGSWSLRTAACGTVHCAGLPGAMSCASGQVCSVTEGGTIGGTCAQSTCGTGPVSCACAHASCIDCGISGSVEQGFTVTCNNCPQGGCP